MRSLAIVVDVGRVRERRERDRSNANEVERAVNDGCGVNTIVAGNQESISLNCEKETPGSRSLSDYCSGIQPRNGSGVVFRPMVA